MTNKDIKALIENEMQSVKDMYAKMQEQQEALIKEQQKEIEEYKNSITELYSMLLDVQIRVHDTQDRAYDILSFKQDISETKKNVADSSDRIRDIEIRMNDVQDRVYNILDQKETLQKIIEREQDIIELEQKIQERDQDIQIRTKDSQNRIHDILWQLKTQAAQISFLFWRLYKNSNETIDDSKYRFFREIPPATGDRRLIQIVLSKLLHTIHDICVANDIAYWLDFGSLLGAVRHGGYIPWDDDIDLGMMRSDMDRLEKILKGDKRFFVRNVYVNRKNGNGVLHLFQVRWADTELGTLRLHIDIFVYDYCQKCSHEDWQWYMKQKAELVEKSMSLPYGAYGKGSDKKFEVLKQTFDPAKQIVDDYFGITYEKSDYILWGFDNVNYLNYCDEHLLKYNMIFPLKKLEFEGKECYVPNSYLEYISSMYEDIFSLPADMLTHNHFKTDDKKIAQLNCLYEMYCK